MADFKKISDLVKYILEQEPQARADDMELYYLYCTKYGYLSSESFKKMFSDKHLRNKLGISTFETISRCRRKLQAEYDNLKPDEQVSKKRIEQEKKFKEFVTR